MNYQAILEEIYEEIKPHFGEGKVANYIPALSEVDPNQFAFSIITHDGNRYDVGDSDVASFKSLRKFTP